MHALGIPMLGLVPAGHVDGARHRAVDLAAAEGSIGRQDWSIPQGRSTTNSIIAAQVRRRPGRSESKHQLTHFHRVFSKVRSAGQVGPTGGSPAAR